MDLQGTKEARKQEDGEGPLDAYGAGSGRSKERSNSHSHHDTPSNLQPLRRRQQPTFLHPPRASRHASVAAPRAPHEPSKPSPEAMAVPQALGLSSRNVRLLGRAKRQPPVTKKTLSELDLPCIMSNINLRMDANFDRDLHFKPDLEGEKGKRKRKEAADYWDAMAAEIAIYSFCAANTDTVPEEGTEGTRKTFEPRLPTMFETLQEVIKTLVPTDDHASVTQNLEVPLLMQQIRKGVLDMVALATWLAALFKTHCAPMRDEWADRMVEQITEGSQSQDPHKIVDGLQTLFAILEAMKLDVANHQIRAFRVLLIEDTVPFLQEYFQGKTSHGTFQVESARLWYLAAREAAQQEDDQRSSPIEAETGKDFRPLEALFRGISGHLLQFHAPEDFPETFLFDSDRLWQLRSTAQNLVNLDVAWYIFESYVHTQKRYLSAPAETYSTFRSRIWSLLEDGSGGARTASADDDPDLRGGACWLRNMRCVALEIARFAGAACCLDEVVADEVIGPIEEALEWHLSNESELFRYFQNAMRDKILASTLASARRYLPLSPLAICDSQRATPPPPAPLPASTTSSSSSTSGSSSSSSSSTSTSISPQQYDIDRVGMRLAHIGILHWRVWAPLLYLRDEIAEQDAPSSS
ncbi:uncharacterized protein PFLUO_LOCUS8103 [Penicillium psychrofluorescens]|uniref:uncharacterized protein n=1 Tax=Penicillium psychrofluorescens TaxID=3158075 RepID=UPI003CCD78FF